MSIILPFSVYILSLAKYNVKKGEWGKDEHIFLEKKQATQKQAVKQTGS